MAEVSYSVQFINQSGILIPAPTGVPTVESQITFYSVPNTFVNLTVSNLNIQQIYANSSFGSSGQVLTSNGSGVYWSTVSSGGGLVDGVNTFASYIWSNNHAFNSQIIVNSSLTANGSNGTNGQVLTSNGSSVYWSTIQDNSATAYSNAVTYVDSKLYANTIQVTSNAATAYSNAVTYVNSKSYVNTSQLSSNLANYQTTLTLSANVITLTANNTNFVGSVSAINVVSNSQLSSNLANYTITALMLANDSTTYTNAVVYVDSKSYANTLQVTSNSATAYSNAVLYVDSKSYANTSELSSNSATAYSNAVLYVDSKSYVNTSQLSSNLANYSITALMLANDSTTYTNAVLYSSNADNITSGTLSNARLSSAVVNTSGNFILAGNIQFSASNIYFGSNASHYSKLNYLEINITDSINFTTITPASIYLNNSNLGSDITISGDGSYSAFGPLGGSIYLNPDVGSVFDADITLNNGNFVLNSGSIFFTNTSFSVNSTIYTGQSITANTSSFIANSSGTLNNIISWITSNSATAYSNAVTYVDSKSYANTIQVTSNAATAYSNAVSLFETRGFTKSITVPSPTNTDIFTLFYTNRALTVNNVIAILPAANTSPNVTFSIISGSNRGTESVLNINAQSVSNITTGSIITIANNTVAANNYMWLKITAVSGSVSEFHATIKFNEVF